MGTIAVAAGEAGFRWLGGVIYGIFYVVAQSSLTAEAIFL